jgi:hypothetical protein
VNLDDELRALLESLNGTDVDHLIGPGQEGRRG